MKYKLIRKSLLFIALFLILFSFFSPILIYSENETLGLKVTLSRYNLNTDYLKTEDNINYFSYPESNEYGSKDSQHICNLIIELENKESKTAYFDKIYFNVKVNGEDSEYLELSKIAIGPENKGVFTIPLTKISTSIYNENHKYNITLFTSTKGDASTYGYNHTYSPVIPPESDTLTLEVLSQEEWDNKYIKKESNPISDINGLFAWIESHPLITGIVVLLVGSFIIYLITRVFRWIRKK